MRPTELDEPASSAAFDRISENSLSVYLFEASLKGELHADKEDALASSCPEFSCGAMKQNATSQRSELVASVKAPSATTPR
jgi:hypothetical protein